MFTILDRISWPGSPDKANEDICGVCQDWAWVIDTSIFPGTAPVVHPKSDAAWLAAFADEHLSNLAPHAQDGATLIRHVMEEARIAYRAVAPQERHEDFVSWPLGAMTLVRRTGNTLDAWTFGDTTAYVRRPDGTVLTLGEAPGLRDFEAAKAAELMRASGSRPGDILDEPVFLAWLGERRERQKKSGVPAALLSLNPAAADRLRHESVPCEDGTAILLASDGFSALVDLYGALDAKDLMESALTSGLEPLARKAREIETQADPEGTRYPRFKVSDDTTALLLRA